MKIDMMEIVESALVGGRNGEMAYIYNNQFIAEIFHKQGVSFKQFLQNILDEASSNNPTTTSSKRVKIYDAAINIDEEYVQMLKEKRELNGRIYKKAKDIIKKESNSPLMELLDFNNGEKVSYDTNKNEFYGYINPLKFLEVPIE